MWPLAVDENEPGPRGGVCIGEGAVNDGFSNLSNRASCSDGRDCRPSSDGKVCLPSSFPDVLLDSGGEI